MQPHYFSVHVYIRGVRCMHIIHICTFNSLTLQSSKTYTHPVPWLNFNELHHLSSRSSLFSIIIMLVEYIWLNFGAKIWNFPPFFIIVWKRILLVVSFFSSPALPCLEFSIRYTFFAYIYIYIYISNRAMDIKNEVYNLKCYEKLVQ